jgi:FAD:protein FMN transferase
VTALARYDVRALGTGCVLLTDPASLGTAIGVMTDELAAVDRACSRFRDDSDLARVNRASGAPTRVDHRLLDALDVAIRAARLTNGDLDPTIGAAIVALGYDRDFAQIDHRASTATVRSVEGWTCIAIDRAASTVTVPAGVSLDLGATAKAWTADRIARLAAQATGAGVLVSLGGDVSVAGTAPNGGWPVRIAEHHGEPVDGPGPLLAIGSGGVATSSTTARRWTAAGATRHHVLDPATGEPAVEVWRTVTVVAASALDANIASTTSIIRGDRAFDWLTGLGLPARLVRLDGSVFTVGAWPREPLPAGAGGHTS